MTESDLDRCYAALARAMAEAGEARAPLFLAMLNLALIARADQAQDVLPLIESVRARLAAEG